MLIARAPRRVVVGLLIVLGGLLSPVAATAAPAVRPSRWTLEDYSQSTCFSGSVHDSFYGIYIAGRWTHQINVGASGLPATGHYTTSYAPIPPGRSNGEYSLAYVHVFLDTNPPVGTYTATLWAREASTSGMQSVPITIEVKTSCGY